MIFRMIANLLPSDSTWGDVSNKTAELEQRQRRINHSLRKEINTQDLADAFKLNANHRSNSNSDS